MHSIHIVSGANSELAKPEILRYMNDQSCNILALFNKTPIQDEKNLIPLQVDLSQVESTEVLRNRLSGIINENTGLISLQHFVGKFKYEPNGVVNDHDGDGIDDEIYMSNTKTFINAINALNDFLISDKIKIKIQSIGALSDHSPEDHNRPSFNKSKSKIKDICASLSSKYKNVYSHIIHTSTIDTGNERKLRPYVSEDDYKHRLSIDEFRSKALPTRNNLHLSDDTTFVEHKIYKPHSNYEKFLLENKESERVRRDKETGMHK